MFPPVDYKPYHNKILQLCEHGYIVDDIITVFRDHDMLLFKQTLKQRLQKWNIFKYNKHTNYNNPILQCRVAVLYFDYIFNDADIIFTLNLEGYNIPPHALQHLRQELGLYYTINMNNVDAEDEVLRQIIQKEFNKGTIDLYGKGLLYTYFWTKHYNIS